jgi:hypothetical protein
MAGGVPLPSNASLLLSVARERRRRRTGEGCDRGDENTVTARSRELEMDFSPSRRVRQSASALKPATSAFLDNDTVRLSSGVYCQCKRQLKASDVDAAGPDILLICQRCHRDILTIERNVSR